jgi:hypothetical protein
MDSMDSRVNISDLQELSVEAVYPGPSISRAVLVADGLVFWHVHVEPAWFVQLFSPSCLSAVHTILRS